MPFEILAVSVDEDRSALVSLLNDRKPPGIQTWDEKGRDNPAATLYNVRGLPTWFLIDPEGVIRKKDPLSDELVDEVKAINKKKEGGEKKEAVEKPTETKGNP